MSKNDYEWTLKYSPGQPRIPAGSPEGGQWTSDFPGWAQLSYHVDGAGKLHASFNSAVGRPPASKPEGLSIKPTFNAPDLPDNIQEYVRKRIHEEYAPLARRLKDMDFGTDERRQLVSESRELLDEIAKEVEKLYGELHG